jgi:hypothetical protein
MEYFKINSLWKREQYVKDKPKGTHGALIIGDYSEPEFGNIKRWRVDEKIDGTNIRIRFSKALPNALGSLSFDGRTDSAQIPKELLVYLERTFTREKLGEVFPDAVDVILYGEGYGPKIQSCGGNYRSDPSFILFDVFANGWWLKRSDVVEIALKLSIDTVPDLGVMSEEDIVEFVKSKPLSRCSMIPQMMEGVVCRSDPLVLFRNGKPLVWKLKCKEFA